ncbi:MAG: inorganic phosphate transporter [Thermoguttaceae bacterium]
MDQYFLVILVFLALLAAFDLFVGVSNDAVNFLNSAIGSRTASFRTIMIVASLGVLIGATFSSGMMEIARSGVFNPQMFTFQEVMIIFFAVMVTDVLLLNVFNAFGLPTSTTVSIVFELLGGAMAAAYLKLAQSGGSVMQIGEYINSQKALAIISGILISVVVAFIAGTLVQWFTRLLFTFKYEKAYIKFGGLFGGIAITSIFYFLVMKGLKGASFMRPEYMTWINANMLVILGSLLVSLTVLFQFLILAYKTNIFRIVILSGTFALAFAFAGNDLVNFVGVPLAAYESYNHYRASGLAPDEFTMESLKNAVQTPTFYLLISGMIMVLTLWFSKKAHRVVQTSINLSSASGTEKEQFSSSLPGRLVVKSVLQFNSVLHHVLPKGFFKAIGNRMEPAPTPSGEVPLPFDNVRASINLIVASILIASATSLKLPLSTTYVTFMVAMGSSFADGAWDRDSAVYRVSGVFMVICGWFFTAFCAFTACAAIAASVFWGGEFVSIAFLVVTVGIIIYSNFISDVPEKTSYSIVKSGRADRIAIRDGVLEAIPTNLDATINLFSRGLEAFLDENLMKLWRVRNETANLSDEISKWRGEYYRMGIRNNEADAVDNHIRYLYYRAFSNMKETSDGLLRRVQAAENHIANSHRIFDGVPRKKMQDMLKMLGDMREQINKLVVSKQYTDSTVTTWSDEGLHQLNQLQIEFLQMIDEHQLSSKCSDLCLAILGFAREIVNRYTVALKLLVELDKECDIPTVQTQNTDVLAVEPV